MPEADEPAALAAVMVYPYTASLVRPVSVSVRAVPV